MITASIVGASGYTGGELLRLLLFHPQVTLRQVTSERLAGKLVHHAHPNLRAATRARFVSSAELEPCDVLFLCLPHGESSTRIDDFLVLAGRVIDLSADFRLHDAADYDKWYGHEHQRPELLSSFVYGLPELRREAVSEAERVACGGCNATAVILALHPLCRRGLVTSAVVEVKAGSSEGGNRATDASHHPERVGCVRSFMPVRHRHVAEMEQELDFGAGVGIHFSATSIEIMGIFDELHSHGNTIILVTHEPDIAEYAHRIVRLRDGKVETDERTR